MSHPVSRFISVLLVALSLSACSGAGSGLGSNTALPPSSTLPGSQLLASDVAPQLSTRNASPEPVQADTLQTGVYTQVQGTVLSNASPASYLLIQLASGRQLKVYAAELSEAKIGETVGAVGYLNTKGNFQASSAYIGSDKLSVDAIITIQGVVVSNAAPATHLRLKLAGGRQLTVYAFKLESATVGDTVRAKGYLNSKGNFQASTASIVKDGSTPSPGPSRPPSPAPSGSPSPAPSPSLTPVGGPTPPPGNTTGRLGLAQIFDFNITEDSSRQNANRYNYVWGAGIGRLGANARSWQSGSSSIVAVQYAYQPAEAMFTPKKLDWYQKNHPDWVVYDCDQNNYPTHTAATQPGLQGVSLDISNRDAVDDQIRDVARQAKKVGAKAVGFDQTFFFIFDGGQHKNWYGCGFYKTPSTFVHRWGADHAARFPNNDATWKHDVAQWAVWAQADLKAYGLRTIINHPAGNQNDADEATLISNVDATANENGFVNYGHYKGNVGLFRSVLAYSRWVQSKGTDLITINRFSGDIVGGGGNGKLSAEQLKWVIATYLISNEGREYLFAGNGYGSEQFHSEYEVANRLGRACQSYTSTGTEYTRKFAHGSVRIDASTSQSSISFQSNC